jgi:hypothetical protein
VAGEIEGEGCERFLKACLKIGVYMKESPGVYGVKKWDGEEGDLVGLLPLELVGGISVQS